MDRADNSQDWGENGAPSLSEMGSPPPTAQRREFFPPWSLRIQACKPQILSSEGEHGEDDRVLSLLHFPSG